MSLRTSLILRILLVCFVIGLAWYTVQLYANLFGLFSTRPTPEKAQDTISHEKNTDKKNVDDPDMLIDEEKIKAAEKEWDQANKEIVVPKELSNFKCQMEQACPETEYTFRVVSGAANVIGPSICFDGKWIMKNSLNNVDRGMNIAVVNGKTGKTTNKGVFDLYGKDSTELKNFIRKVQDEEIVLATTYDDAAFRLDDEARNLMADLGSEKVKKLAFRDNWIFVGGKKMKLTKIFENLSANDKAKNKFGDWPEAITIEGCIPKFQ